MINIGIIKKIDSLGRITIPKDIRSMFHLTEGTPVEVFVTNQGILIRNLAFDVRFIAKYDLDVPQNIISEEKPDETRNKNSRNKKKKP